MQRLWEFRKLIVQMALRLGFEERLNLQLDSVEDVSREYPNGLRIVLTLIQGRYLFILSIEKLKKVHGCDGAYTRLAESPSSRLPTCYGHIKWLTPMINDSSYR